MSVTQMSMPNYLRQMELKVANGADPDEIDGIEQLWLWRFKMRLPEFEREERKFLEWVKKQPLAE